MRKLIYLTVFTILLGCSIIEIRAENLQIGAKFAVDKLTREEKTADNTIVVFMPSLTYDCNYASMLTRSFYYYFDRQMAFEGLKKSPTTRIFLVVKDKVDLLKSAQNLFGGMTVIYDEKGELFSAFNVNQPANKNSDSTVVLLDSNETVAHVDANYRAQGEHLKPLENKLKELNGIYEKVQPSPSQKVLKIGDKALDFRVNEKEMLSDLRGSVVLISFYPAAFSGKLPKPAPITIDTNWLGKDGKFPKPVSTTIAEWLGKDEAISSENSFIIDGQEVSCFRQGLLLDKKSKNKTRRIKVKTRRIMISSSTNSLLSEWKEVLETENIEYANDPDYSISSKYFSYNLNGYNNRVTVIIDRKGKIAYVDSAFDVNDEAVFNEKIDELLNK